MQKEIENHLLHTEEDAEVPGTADGSTSAPEACNSSSEFVSEEEPASLSPSIFFARVPPVVSPEELTALFSRFGTVVHLNLFRRWATAKTSKGCGTVQYNTVEEATAALKALNGIYSFEGVQGCEGPMVVEWMDPARLSSPTAASAALKANKASKRRLSSAKGHNKFWGRSVNASSSSTNNQQVWQHAQQLAMGSAAVAAAAAVAAGYDAFPGALGGMHPDAAAAALSSLHHSLNPGLDALALGLGDLTNRGSTVPIHLLPVLYNEASAAGMCCPPLPTPYPMMSSAAAAAAAATAAAAAAAAQVTGPVSTGLEGLPRPASVSLGCPTPNFGPWMPGSLSLPSRNSRGSTSGTSFASQSVGSPPSAGSLYAAQQQAQQMMLTLDDVRMPRSCEALPQGNSYDTASQGGGSRTSSTGSYALFDSSALICSLGADAAAEAAAVLGQSCSSPLFGSSTSETSSLLAGMGHSGALSGSLSGASSAASDFFTANQQPSDRRSSSPGSIGSYGNGSALQHALNTAETGKLRQQPLQQRDTLRLDLSDDALCKLAPHIPHVAKASGAEFQLTVAASGLQLHLHGTASQLDAACSILRLLWSGDIQ